MTALLAAAPLPAEAATALSAMSQAGAVATQVSGTFPALESAWHLILALGKIETSPFFLGLLAWLAGLGHALLAEQGSLDAAPMVILSLGWRSIWDRAVAVMAMLVGGAGLAGVAGPDLLQFARRVLAGEVPAREIVPTMLMALLLVFGLFRLLGPLVGVLPDAMGPRLQVLREWVRRWELTRRLLTVLGTVGASQVGQETGDAVLSNTAAAPND